MLRPVDPARDGVEYSMEPMDCGGTEVIRADVGHGALQPPINAVVSPRPSGSMFAFDTGPR